MFFVLLSPPLSHLVPIYSLIFPHSLSFLLHIPVLCYNFHCPHTVFILTIIASQINISAQCYVLLVCLQPMDLSWNPYSCGGLFMSAPSLVEKLRHQQCPLSRQFLTALSLCHTVMAEWKDGELECVSKDTSEIWKENAVLPIIFKPSNHWSESDIITCTDKFNDWQNASLLDEGMFTTCLLHSFRGSSLPGCVPRWDGSRWCSQGTGLGLHF